MNEINSIISLTGNATGKLMGEKLKLTVFRLSYLPELIFCGW
jgi:hypothetical protein